MPFRALAAGGRVSPRLASGRRRGRRSRCLRRRSPERASRKTCGGLDVTLAANERFRVLTEQEFFAGAGLDAALAASSRARPGRRRSRRMAGVMALAGAVGTVAGAVALAYMPRASRTRPNDSARAYAHRHAGVSARAVRVARTRVQPRPAVPAIARHEFRPAHRREIARLLERRARSKRARAPHAQDVARVAAEPVRAPAAPRKAVSAAVTQVAHARQISSSTEFSFER